MSYKIRTIDVWDTLLRRDCHPECIKLATAQHLLLGWRTSLKPAFRDGWSLYRARLEVERSIAREAKASGKDDEYEIVHVFTRWAYTVFASSFPAELPEDLTKFEFGVEIERSFADPEIGQLLDSHPADKTLFLSDFYMTSEMLGRLLASKGLGVLASEGISSCDVGLNKRSGRLFEYIHAKERVAPGQHVHIGDNEWSDVLSPRAKGIHTLHYLPQALHSQRIARESLFASRSELYDHIHLKVSELVSGAEQQLTKTQAVAMRLGAEAAPLMVGYILWVAERSISEKLDKLFFFTREGEFFYEVFCSLFPNRQLCGHALPTASVLAVSRQSTFAPSMQAPMIGEMSRIWSLFKVQSVSGLFSTLGLDSGNYIAILDEVGLKEADTILDPANSEQLRQLFENPVFVADLRRSLSHHSDLLRQYLGQSGITSCNRVGVVDIGWRGTIQDNLALVLPGIHFDGMYLGLRRFVNSQPANTTKASYGPNENLNQADYALFSNFAAMELLCTPRGGSVVGYLEKGGYVIPCRSIDGEVEEDDGFVEFFQQGVLLAARTWQPYLQAYVVCSSELRATALQVWKNIARSPNEMLVEAFLAAPQHDFFGYGEVFRRNRYPALSTTLLSLVIPSRRGEVVEFVRRVQWSEAIANAKGLRPLHRWVLLALFRAAHLIRYLERKLAWYRWKSLR